MKNEKTKSLKNLIIANASWIVICKVVQSIIGLIIGMLTARYLGPSNYGIINYAASVVAFFIPLMQLGLRSTLVQEFIDSPEKEGRILGTALLMNLISSLMCVVCIIGFVSVVNRGEQATIIVCALYSLNLIFQALEMIQYWFQSKYMSKYYSVTALISYFIVALYKVFLLVTGKSVYWFAISTVLDYMLISVVLIFIYRKIGNDKLSVSFSEGKRMIDKSKYYIVSSLMVTIFANTDSIMLKLMIDESATGLYTAAVVCAGMTSFVFSAIIDSVRPSIFSSLKNSVLQFEKSVVRLYSIIIYLSLIQCVVICIFAEIIIKILYGIEYTDSIDPLRVIVWYSTFSYLGAVRNIWILAENKQKYLWIINLTGAVFNVTFNFIMIPIMGIMGAAIASLLTQIWTNVVVSFVIKPIRRNNILMLKALNPKLIWNIVKMVVKR